MAGIGQQRSTRKRSGRKPRKGFDLSAWEIIDRTLIASGMLDAQANVDAGGEDRALPSEQARYGNGFAWPDKRFRFRPDWPALGSRGHEMPTWPDHFAVIDEATPGKPYRLVTAPARTFLNSTFTETPSSVAREKAPCLRICPDDAAALGVATGDQLRLGNEQGELVVPARLAEGQQRGVVVLEGIWPGTAFTGGYGVNLLTSADPGWPNGGAVFHDTAIWIRAEAAGRP